VRNHSIGVPTSSFVKAAYSQRKEDHPMAIVWMIVLGLIVGLVARAVMPGTQHLGLAMTALLGIVGSLVFGLLGRALGLYGPQQGAGFIGSVVGALIVLFVVGKLQGPRASVRP
jgi:uncharacterized membrane protein YeaQ/YmgE (transglycosylase-associated protein family)